MDSLNTMGLPGMGTFSCFHDGEEKRLPLTDGNEIRRGIEQYYEEAARRLPLNQMPELRGCIHAGGHCFGLGDPVTNIILNAIALLRREHLPPPPPQSQTPTGGWFQIASRSHTGLRAFMTAYFRYLSITQAQRYLCLASHDLSLAIKLVHHDRAWGRGSELLPDGGKIKAALRIAALEAHHPAPDVLAGLMTARYPSDLLSSIMGIMQRQEPLSTNQVGDIKDLLDSQWPPTPSPANIELCFHPSSAPRLPDYRSQGATLLEFIAPFGGEDLMARISIQYSSDFYRHHDYISKLGLYNEDNMIKLSNLQIKHVPPSSSCDASPCEHMRYLKMHLLETIHASYIKALAKFPSSVLSARLLQALLVAGHCYGFLDCVSNIILNSIWYSITLPVAQDADNVQLPQGILCTRALSHLESCSLIGMVTILRGNEGFCNYSDHEAFGLLDRCNCNLTPMIPSDISLSAAAKAAKHPKHDYFATFLTALHPDKRHHLSYLLGQPGRISDANWDIINKIIHEETWHALSLKMETEAPSGLSPFVSHGRSPITFPRWFYQRTSTFAKEVIFPSSLLSSPEMSSFATPEKSSFTSPLAPEMSLFPSPVSTLCSPGMSIEASIFKDKLTFVCGELNKVLRDYCYKNPWESSYKLDIVCGVMESARSFCHPNLYHVNFLVSRDGAANDSSERKLFFAEFWEPNCSSVQLKLPSCSPVPDYFAYTGRCTICEIEGSMIVHPPSGGHSGDIKGLVDLCSDVVHNTYKVSSNEADTNNFLDLDSTLRAPPVWTDGHRFPGLPLTQA